MDHHPDDPSTLLFCVFKHAPFKKGTEGGEDASAILQQLIYRYPSTVSDRLMEHLLGVLISLYTFTNLSLEGKALDFISWSNSKVAIRTSELPDGTIIFFVLRIPSIYSDHSVCHAIEYIKKGFSFVLGPGINNEKSIEDLLEKHGDTILAKVMPMADQSPLSYSFTSIPIAEWHRGSVSGTLISLQVMRLDPKIWGVSIFLNDLLLVSHSPLELVRLFNFVDDTLPRQRVYLSSGTAESLKNYKGCIAQIPDGELIEADLLRVEKGQVIFYVLVSPDINDDIISKLENLLNAAAPLIGANACDALSPQYPSNTIAYDRELNLLKAGAATDTCKATAIYAHDAFAGDPNLRDVVVANARELTVCMNVMSVEHYSSVPMTDKDMRELYDIAMKLNPELLAYLQGLYLPTA